MAVIPAGSSTHGYVRSSARIEAISISAHQLVPRLRPNVSGNGYLGGSFPSGITTVDGTPVPATIRIHLRPEEGAQGDGILIAQTTSAHDGTWRVDGLNPALRYDVVGRKAGLKDVIMSNVQPKVD